MARRTVSFSDAMRLFGGGGGAGGPGGARGGESGDAGEGEGNGEGGTQRRRDDGPPPESVTQLAARIKGALERLGDPVRVRGEVSNFVEKGHWYFSLKDEGAVIGCAMWQEQARRVGWTPREGDAVVATGSVSFFPKQGRTQIYVRSIERVGAGSLQERFEALCRELRGLGYFDDTRKLPLPSFPRRVAIVTSATGAAVHDCLRTAAHRCPAVGLVLVDVRVQGDGAAAEVARAVRALDRHAERMGIDAILVTRGGGSIEDLWAFNEREVADAIYARRNVPIVAAIGHESDITIAELVADRRASTPTQAMMLLTPDRAELAEQVDSIADRLDSSLRRSVRERRELLARIGKHAFLRSPLAPFVERRRRLDEARRRLDRATQTALATARSEIARSTALLASLRPDVAIHTARREVGALERRLRHAVAERAARAKADLDARRRQLEAVSPEQVLARGYSYTMTADGRILRRVSEAPAGTELATHLIDGTVRSRVEGEATAPRLAMSAPSGTSSGATRAPAASATSGLKRTPQRRPSDASFDLFQSNE